MTYNVSYDVSRFLDASIHEVVRTLVEAFLLVSVVVFIFLQDWRSTLIPALAVPVSLIGAFFFMQLLGFSVNLLTLFALVLAIGIVVDNAIVVVEAVHVKMAEGLDARAATIAAMKEISGALVAITLVMSAVFVPVAFMSGPVGIFYRQFSLTLAVAIVISGINALTLTPALCALMLKPVDHHHHAGNGWLARFFNAFNKRYDAISLKYSNLVGRIAARKVVTVAMLALFFIATWGMTTILPSGFIPTEDQGMIYVNVTTPSGATVERTEKVMDDIEQAASKVTGVESVSTLAGFSLMTDGAGSSYGMGMINLVPWSERKGVWDVIRDLEQHTAHIKDATIQYFPPPTVPGFGNSSGFELRLLDRTGTGDLANTSAVTNQFVEAVSKRPEIGSAFTSFDVSFPQYLIHVDQDMAAQKGITIENAMSNLQTLIGSLYATNFIRFGQMYKVMVQADAQYRSKPDDLLKLYAKNNAGEMVPYSTFIRLERVYGPEQLTRYNMFTAAMINGDAAPGYSSGDAINAIKEVAAETLPRGFTYEWSGMTREEILSGNQAIYIFIICLVFVYLLLAAQYESLLLPLAVILSLPCGIFGAFLFLKLLGLQNNIYAQVSLVMLIGLLGKNAILIVEFAILKLNEGASVLRAAVEGATARLRPILMTSFAFIAGLIPLVVASGAGALGNRSIGTAALGGMFIGTVFGVILVPGLFVIFARMSGQRQGQARAKSVPVEEPSSVS